MTNPVKDGGFKDRRLLVPMSNRATSKTAAEMLAEKMEELIDNAAETMTDHEFKTAEKRSDAITDRIHARS